MSKINVIVGRQRNIQVSANATGGSITSDKTPVTLKNVSTVSASRLDTLKDVVASGETDGAVPVYDATLDKYVVQKLSFVDVIGDLDGGTF